MKRISRTPKSDNKDRSTLNHVSNEEGIPALIHDAPFGFYIIQDDRIVYANRHAAKLFGYTSFEEINSPSPFEVIAPEDHKTIQKNIEKHLRGEDVPFQYMISALHKSGRRIEIELRGDLTTHNGKPAIQGLILDVSERKSVEQELIRRNHELTVLNFLSNVISSARTFDNLFSIVDRVLRETINADRIAMHLAERYGPAYYSDGFSFASLDPSFFSDATVKENVFLYDKVSVSHEPSIYSSDTVTDGIESILPDVRSAIALPIILHNKFLGMLRIDNLHVARKYREDDIQFFVMVCRHISNAVENIIRYQKEKERAKRLESVRIIIRELTSILNPHELMQRAVRLISELYGYSYAAIFLLRPSDTYLHFHTGYGKNAYRDPEGLRIKLGEGPIGTCAKENTIVVSNRISQFSDWMKEILDGNSSEMCIPLRTGSGMIGVLDIHEKNPDVFSVEDSIILQILVDELTAVFENALLFEEIRYQANVLTNINDAVISTDANWNIKGWNNGAFHLYGWKQEEVIGKNLFQLIHNEYINATPEEILNAMVFHGGWRGEIRQETKAHRIVFVSTVSSTIRGNDGAISGYIMMNRDMTQELELQHTLQETEGLLSSVIDQTPFGIQVFTVDGTLIRVNQAFMRMFKIPHRDLLEYHYNILSDSLFTKALGISQKVEKAFGGDSTSAGPMELQPDILPPPFNMMQGSLAIDMKFFPVFDRENMVRHVVFLYDDVSEQINLQHQLIQSQKMEAVGTLAGGIAHDFNNLLGGILGYASFAKTKIAQNSPVFGYLDTIEKSATRASELTRQLLGFARRGKFAVEKIDCNDVIRETVKLLERSFDKRIQIRTDLSSNPAIIDADSGQVEQTLLNLCVNARDAMPDGGSITIRTQIVDVNDDYVRTHLGSQERKYVQISVEDSGVGMDEETQKHIFEPFFTTKEKGKGTGLGLSMVYGIVRNHEGFINIYSEIGHGSVFHLYFPYNTGDVQQKSVENQTTDFKEGNEVILLVDDEEVIRDLTREVLESQGYQVLVAKDGDDAIKIFNDCHDRIDAVVLDMVMPQKGGLETYRVLKKIKPNVKVLLSSGYSQEGNAQDILDEGVLDFVQKPYNINQFSKTVRRILDLKEGES